MGGPQKLGKMKNLTLLLLVSVVVTMVFTADLVGAVGQSNVTEPAVNQGMQFLCFFFLLIELISKHSNVATKSLNLLQGRAVDSSQICHAGVSPATVT